VFFSDADLKLAPFFDGYDRRRFDEHEKELNVDHFSSHFTHRFVNF
jgi:hypothetical protein